jgi:hypothetical protein
LNFRVVWCFNEPTDPKTHKEIYETLTGYVFKDFEGVDTSTKNPSRLFFGGNSYAVVVNPEETSLSTLGWAKVLEAYQKGLSNQNVHRQKNAAAPNWEEIEVPDAIVVGAKWFDKLRPYCALMDKWMKAEYLDYNQRLSLWSNLKFLKRKSNNDSVIKDVMFFVDPEVYKNHTFNVKEIQGKFRDSHLKPAPIVFYRGKRMTVPEFFNTFTDAPIVPDMTKRKQIKVTNSWMVSNVVPIIKESGFKYLQCQTGSGKTEQAINFIVSDGGRNIYAAPTHSLAKEIEERCVNKNPDAPIYRIAEREYSSLDLTRMQLGLPPKSSGTDPVRKERLQMLHNAQLDGTFLLTHQSLLTSGENVAASTVIIDENIEEALITEIKISVPQLRMLTDYIDKDKRYLIDEVIDELRETQLLEEVSDKIKQVVRAIDKDKYIEEVNEKSVIENLFLIEKADKFWHSQTGMPTGADAIRAIVRSPMIQSFVDRGSAIVLMSATPMPQLVKLYYKDLPFKFYEAPEAVNQGKIVQYRGGYTGARGNANGNGMGKKEFEKADRAIKARLPKDVYKKCGVISFFGSSKLWEDAGYHTFSADGKEIHFMNNQGLDFMKGKDIIIVGKPDLPDIYYYDL